MSEDNVYVTPSLVRQIVSDLAEQVRDQKRRAKCPNCSFIFLKQETPTVQCPRCKHGGIDVAET